MAQGSSSNQTYEFRCPVHGFIKVNHWGRDVIDHPAFQRLRRIRQLGWTDYVYPGGTHTRFEHSLGVMHVLTRMYNAISARSSAVLHTHLNYDRDGIGKFRDLQLMRFAALLHDIGHAPFSHAAEALLPYRPKTTRRYSHEDYSAAIIRHELKDVIENHPANQNMMLTAEEIASLIDGTSRNSRALFWRELIDGQMDADRMDQRDHFRQIWESSESPLADEQESLDALLPALGDLVAAQERSDRSWYKTGNPDIQVATDNSEEVRPLSDYSPVIKQLIATPHRQVRLYSRREVAGRAKQIINDEARRSS